MANVKPKDIAEARTVIEEWTHAVNAAEALLNAGAKTRNTNDPKKELAEKGKDKLKTKTSEIASEISRLGAGVGRYC